MKWLIWTPCVTLALTVFERRIDVRHPVMNDNPELTIAAIWIATYKPAHKYTDT